jgi:hypothetical protein
MVLNWFLLVFLGAAVLALALRAAVRSHDGRSLERTLRRMDADPRRRLLSMEDRRRAERLSSAA